MDTFTNIFKSNVRIATIATKICLPNGQWYTNSEDIPWSKYSLCKLSDEFTARYNTETVVYLGNDITHTIDCDTFVSYPFDEALKSEEQAAHASVRFSYHESVYGTPSGLDFRERYWTSRGRKGCFYQATKRRHVKCERGE